MKSQRIRVRLGVTTMFKLNSSVGQETGALRPSDMPYGSELKIIIRAKIRRTLYKNAKQKFLRLICGKDMNLYFYRDEDEHYCLEILICAGKAFLTQCQAAGRMILRYQATGMRAMVRVTFSPKKG